MPLAANAIAKKKKNRIIPLKNIAVNMVTPYAY